jgi:predicted DsbA family dithiol-disulfide isomerase
LEAALRILTPRIRGRLVWRGLPIGRTAAETALARPDSRRFLTGVGAVDGIRFELDRIARVPDTRAALSLVARVRDSGYGGEIVDQLVENIYRALWSEGRDIESPATLDELSGVVGIEPRGLGYLGTAPSSNLLADQHRAAALEIDSIPFVLINDRIGVRGTRSTRHLAAAIEGASWFAGAA